MKMTFKTISLKQVEAERDEWKARAEAAEADAAKWRELHDDRDRDLAFEFARANAAETEVAQLRTALDLIDAARAKAVNEIETMHRYLDECFAFAPDEGRAVPLIDRVVLLVSRWAKADGEVDALRARAEAAEAKASMSWSEVERLDVELATAEAKIDRLSCWIVEADAAFNTDNKPAESLDDCLGLVRMCHEGAAALHEVQKQQAETERLRAALAQVSAQYMALLERTQDW